jgi:hypothetical protein
MNSICIDNNNQPFQIDPVNGFLAKGADSGGKGDFQGCSEFNPDMVFSKPEEEKFKQPQNKVDRDEENRINRRVTVYLFRSNSEVKPASWPCPRVKEGVAQCRTRFHADGNFRRTPRGDQRRTFEKEGDTFACNFYDRIAVLSPCEQGPELKRICCKQRGIVLNNVDPLQIGRLQVSVPSVTDQALFAMPAVPYAGPGVGFLALPPIGANVWVDFERGDITLPVWSGCFWNAGEIPTEAAGQPSRKVLKTDRVTLILDGTAVTGGFSLIVASTGSLTMNSGGIAFDNGTGASIVETGPAISINQGAVEVV